MGVNGHYPVANDRAMVNRGNLTTWTEEAWIREKRTPPPEGRGKPRLKSETARRICVTIKAWILLPYLATGGPARSLLQWYRMDSPVPGLSRRAGGLSLKIPRRLHRDQTEMVVDSAGRKIFRHGDWAKARFREALLPAAAGGRLCKAGGGTVGQHRVSRRRIWGTNHLAVKETSEDNSFGIEVTTTAYGDSEVPAGRPDQFEGQISQVLAYWAYKNEGCRAVDCRTVRMGDRAGTRRRGVVGRRPPTSLHSSVRRSERNRRVEGRYWIPSLQRRLEPYVLDQPTRRPTPALPRVRTVSHRRLRWAAPVITFTYPGLGKSVRAGQLVADA